MNTLARCTAALTLAAATFASAQMAPVTDHGKSVDGKPLASPAAVAETTLAGKAITIHYNTPSMRGRKIYGELVPFDHWWRTGANPATSFMTATDLKIGSLTVPAGSYTLYTIPEKSPSSWILIVNKQTGQWGTVYNQDQDLGRAEMKSTTLPAPQEVMSISFEKTTAKSTELHIKWETTDAYIKLEVK